MLHPSLKRLQPHVQGNTTGGNTGIAEQCRTQASRAGRLRRCVLSLIVVTERFCAVSILFRQLELADAIISLAGALAAEPADHGLHVQRLDVAACVLGKWVEEIVVLAAVDEVAPVGKGEGYREVRLQTAQGKLLQHGDAVAEEGCHVLASLCRGLEAQRVQQNKRHCYEAMMIVRNGLLLATDW